MRCGSDVMRCMHVMRCRYVCVQKSWSPTTRLSNVHCTRLAKRSGLHVVALGAGILPNRCVPASFLVTRPQRQLLLHSMASGERCLASWFPAALGSGCHLFVASCSGNIAHCRDKALWLRQFCFTTNNHRTCGFEPIRPFENYRFEKYPMWCARMRPSPPPAMCPSRLSVVLLTHVHTYIHAYIYI